MENTSWHENRKSSPHINRGRNAERPKEIPKPGWKDTLKRVKKGIADDHLSMVAAAMAYYSLFALVPSLTAIVLIYAWISDPQDISNHLDTVSNFMPKELQAIIQNQLSTLAGKTSVGWGAIGALAIALWSASKGSKAIIEGLNVIYDEKEKRGFFKLNLLAIGMTLLGAVLSIVAIGVIIGIPAVMNFLNLGGFMATAATVLSWVVLLFLFTLFLSIAFRYGPSREKAQWQWVSWGAVIASVLFAVVSFLFSWYAKEFGNFNKTYGSLGAVIVLMTWFYLSSFVVLLGGEINAEMEHQTGKDSTDGEDKPMGKRGAHMADTLGESPYHH